MSDITIQDRPNSQNKTAKEILEEANEIHGKWKQLLKKKKIKYTELREEKNHAKVDKIFTKLQKEYHDFAISYPIQLRYMCQLGQYHPVAMKLYLSQIEHKPWKSEDEYIEYQANYVRLVYMKKHKHWTRNELNNVYNTTYNILKSERTEFKERVTKAQESLEQEQIGREMQKRQEMLEILRQKLIERKNELQKQKEEVETKVVE